MLVVPCFGNTMVLFEFSYTDKFTWLAKLKYRWVN